MKPGTVARSDFGKAVREDARSQGNAARMISRINPVLRGWASCCHSWCPSTRSPGAADVHLGGAIPSATPPVPRPPVGDPRDQVTGETSTPWISPKCARGVPSVQTMSTDAGQTGARDGALAVSCT